LIEVGEIRQIASQWDIPEETIERDYVLGWLLWGFASHEELQRHLVFRGGTCLKKCYVDTHRYSEDLDFTAFGDAHLSINELSSFVNEILKNTTSTSGIDFLVRKPKFRYSEDRQFIHGKAYFRGPRNTPSPISVKLDICISEPLIRPPVLRKIGHPYGDVLPESNEIYSYGLEELFAEKLRALGERCRPRDLYDNVYLFRRADIHAEPGLISEVLKSKCEAKGVAIPSIERLESDACQGELRREWASMLGHQLGQLPDFEDFFGEIKNLFNWLRGVQLSDDELLPIESKEEWSPPPIEWLPGEDEKLEPVRFAAVNRLCLDLGYKGSNRMIEPYSLRRTRAGRILLFAIRTDTRALRSYRIDRIQSVKVTHEAFIPVNKIEFSPEGRLSAPPTRRRYGVRRRSRTSWTRKPRSISPTVIYVIRCATCGKEFKRKKYDLSLRPHKHKDSRLDCLGTIGIYVRTDW